MQFALTLLLHTSKSRFTCRQTIAKTCCYACVSLMFVLCKTADYQRLSLSGTLAVKIRQGDVLYHTLLLTDLFMQKENTALMCLKSNS